MKTSMRWISAIVALSIGLVAGTPDVCAQGMMALDLSPASASNVQGVKSKLVTQAVKTMAKALRKRGKTVL